MAYQEHKLNHTGLSNEEDLKYIQGLIDSGNFEHMQHVEEVQNKMLSDNCVYSGQIKINTQFKHGFGAQAWPDGAKYVGEWSHGKAEGNGCFYHTNGDIFMG